MTWLYVVSYIVSVFVVGAIIKWFDEDSDVEIMAMICPIWPLALVLALLIGTLYVVIVFPFNKINDGIPKLKRRLEEKKKNKSTINKEIVYDNE